MNKGGNQTEYNKEHIRDFRKGMHPNIHPLVTEQPRVDILFLELLLQQVHNHRDFPGEDVNDKYKGQVHVEHRYDEN